MKVPERPIVEFPKQGEDRPVWAKAGVIAVIGFALGIAWPRLAGVRLGPTPPEENKPAAAVSASASPARSAPGAAASAPLAAPASASAAASQPGTTIAVTAGKVLSCKNAKGKAQDECDTPDFDRLIGPKLKGLAKCGAVNGLAGKLSVGFDLDFNRNKWKLVRGKSTTLPEKAAQPVWQCLENDLQKLVLDDVTHKHARYSMFYTVQIVAPGKTADIEGMPEAEKSDDKKSAKEAEDGKTKEAGLGSGSVVYDAALVRDEPKEGKVVARLVRGTKVELLSKKGGWYKIRFGENREGWVYSGSIAQ